MPDPNITITCTNNTTHESIVDIERNINLSRMWIQDDIQIVVDWQSDEKRGVFQVSSTRSPNRKFEPVFFAVNQLQFIKRYQLAFKKIIKFRPYQQFAVLMKVWKCHIY